MPPSKTPLLSANNLIPTQTQTHAQVGEPLYDAVGVAGGGGAPVIVVVYQRVGGQLQ